MNSKSRNFDWQFAASPKEGTGIDRLIPAHVSTDCRELIKSLLQYDPDLRPTAHRAIGHSYFNELRYAQYLYTYLSSLLYYYWLNIRDSYQEGGSKRKVRARRI